MTKSGFVIMNAACACPPFSEEMTYYVETDGLGFGMASAARYRDAMATAGFTDIQMTDRNAWYRPLVEKEALGVLALLQALMVNPVRLPKLDALLFRLGKVKILWSRFK